MCIYTDVGTVSCQRRSHIAMGKINKKEKRPLSSDSDSDSGPEDSGPAKSKMKKFSKGETPKSTSKPARPATAALVEKKRTQMETLVKEFRIKRTAHIVIITENTDTPEMSRT